MLFTIPSVWRGNVRGQEGKPAKVKALSMYNGVMIPYSYPCSEEYITGLAAYRGSHFQLDNAEEFEFVLKKYE